MSKTLKAGICYILALLSFVMVRILSCYGIFSSFTGFIGDLKLTFIIQVVCLIAIPLSFYKLINKSSIVNDFKDFGFVKISKNTTFLCIILGIIAYILNICVSTFWSFLLVLLGFAPQSAGVSVPYTNVLDLIVSLISTAVLPAFCEEFLHRGMTQCLIKEEKSYVFSVVLTSILFGLFHLNIYQTGYAAFLGLLMGFLAVFSGSIYPAIIIHFMNNAINVLVNYFYDTAPIFKTMFEYFDKFLTNLQGANLLILIVVFTLFILVLCYFVYRIFIKVIKNEKLKDVDFSSKDIALAVLYFNEKEKLSLKDTNLLNQVNQIQLLLKQTYPKNQKKLEFKDYIMLINAVFMSTLITIFTLVWGIL